jgi:hypothetical protein
MPGASWGNQNRTVAAVLVCKMFGAAVIAGAAAGTHGAIHADEPSDIRKNFVQRCLSEGGYDVIGWQ